MIPSVLFPLLLCLLMLIVLVHTYRRELLGEYHFALGALNYNPGGLVVPRGYWVPGMPSNSGAIYPAPVASITRGFWQINLATVATYNTKTFTLRQQLADGGFTAIEFEFYVSPTPAPSLPIIGIDLTGLTTTSQVASAIGTALAVQGFRVSASGPQLIVTQPFPGSAGDLGFFVDFAAINAINIGPDFGQLSHAFQSSGNTVFFGGVELSVPIRAGLIYGMAPVATPVQ